MNPKKQIAKYIAFDYLSAVIAWTLFYIYRKKVIEKEKFGIEMDLNFDPAYLKALILIPIFWVSFYAVTGAYKNIYRRHRLKELSQVSLLSILGVTFLFFILILDDQVPSHRSYYSSYLTLLGLQFFFSFFFRYILTNQTVKKIHRREFGFNTLIIGGSQVACDAIAEIESVRNYPGNKFVGFVSLNGADQLLKKEGYAHLGEFENLVAAIKKHEVQEVLIAVDSTEHKNIGKILNELQDTDVIIKIIPDMYDIMAGSVKMTNIFGAPLILINPELMPVWQMNTKRLFDILSSVLALCLLSPVFIIISALVWTTSKGPVFFAQIRVGKHKKPFKIYKFRTMYEDAEKNGPQLSSKNDSRITAIGKILRKTRLDEIPQFFNVLKGEMSIVGPRPERKYFIDKIVKKAPHYAYLHKVKPGITSWGQVKYGYAESVDQMVQRLKFDLLYIENMSLALDFKVMFYTILIILRGVGK